MTNPPSSDPVDEAVRLLDALLDSADVQTVGVSDWWDRARTALETAAAGAEDFAHLVSIGCRKLQIDSLNERASRTIADLGTALADRRRFEEFRGVAHRDAVYLTALTRVHRQNAHHARQETK